VEIIGLRRGAVDARQQRHQHPRAQQAVQRSGDVTVAPAVQDSPVGSQPHLDLVHGRRLRLSRFVGRVATLAVEALTVLCSAVD
jgi:hypothetical protein